MVKPKKITFLTLVVLIPLISIAAAENPIVSINLVPTLTYNSYSDSWNSVFNSDLSISLSSKREGNVRGEVVLEANTLKPITKLDDVLQKAYFKAKFPSFRLTAGKTRLSWGDGVLFNAADVLYGSNDTSVSLTQTELRSSNSYLASINYPLGFFSFAELVLMASESNNPLDTSIGARFYTLVKNVKLEGGYATHKREEVDQRIHKPYVSFQGNLFVDWYFSTSIDLPATKESWVISGGLFHLVELPLGRSITLRLEFLSRPLGSWKWGAVSDDSATLLLFPDLVFVYSPALSFTLRSIISPLDFSTLNTIGVNWNLFDAFNLVGSISVATGNDGDLFAWSSSNPLSPPSLSLTIGSSWIF
jgi:hypothetical protein